MRTLQPASFSRWLALSIAVFPTSPKSALDILLFDDISGWFGTVDYF
jgi:hypothetical protein